MEPPHEVTWQCRANGNGKYLQIQYQDSNRYVELERYLKKTGKEKHHGPSPEVILQIGEAEVAIHTTLLAALSSFWRTYLHNSNKDLQIIHTVPLDIPVGHNILVALKSLLYCGETVISDTSVEHVVTAMKSLRLDDLRFTYCDNISEKKVLLWEGHQDLMKGLQQLCIGQLCTDLSIFVKGHLIKVHRYVFCAFSPLLESIFTDNKKPILLHLPGFSVESVQNLVSLMYFGRASIEKHFLQEFHDLCKFLGINSLEMETKRFCIAKPKTREDQIIDKQKCDTVCLKPEIKNIIQRLTALYNMKSKKDLTLLVDGKRIITSKAILSALCPNVHSLLMEEYIDAHSVILITDADYNSVKCLISVIYRGSCSVAEEHCNITSCYLDENVFINEINQEPIYEEEKAKIVEKSKDRFFRRKHKRKRNKRCSFKTPIEEGCSLHVKSPKKCRRHSKTSVPSTSAQNTGTESNSCDEVKSRDRCKLNRLYDVDFSQCHHCGIRFSSATSLHQHMKSHLETPSVSRTSSEVKIEKRFFKQTDSIPCVICDRKYVKKAFLQKHMKTSHSLELKCINEFSSNMKRTNEKEHLTCPECKTTFRTRKLLKTHLKSDHKKDMFHCSRCNAVFNHPDELRHHRECSHSVLGTSSAFFTCSVCNRNFRRKASMIGHQRHCQLNQNKSSVLDTTEASELKNEEAFSVKNTDFRFLTQKNLNQCLNDLHSTGSKELEGETQDSVKNPEILEFVNETHTESENIGFLEIPISETANFSCPECGEIFDSIEEFTEHAEQEGHGQLEKSHWICGICGSVYLEESKLTEHFSSHSSFHLEDNFGSDSPKKKVIYHNIESPYSALHHEDNIINSYICDSIQNEQNITEGTSKMTLPYRTEADSSVMDGEILEKETAKENDMTSDSDSDIDVVTSSMNN